MRSPTTRAITFRTSRGAGKAVGLRITLVCLELLRIRKSKFRTWRTTHSAPTVPDRLAVHHKRERSRCIAQCAQPKCEPVRWNQREREREKSAKNCALLCSCTAWHFMEFYGSCLCITHNVWVLLITTGWWSCSTICKFHTIVELKGNWRRTGEELEKNSSRIGSLSSNPTQQHPKIQKSIQFEMPRNSGRANKLGIVLAHRIRNHIVIWIMWICIMWIAL